MNGANVRRVWTKRQPARIKCACRFPVHYRATSGIASHDPPGLLWVAGLVFVMNRQLLVGVIALAGIAERFFPKLSFHPAV